MSERLVAAVGSRVEVLAIAVDARTLAAAHGLSIREAQELSLVIAELGMNALRHGGGGGLVQVTLDERGWTVEVEDGGSGLTPAVLADAGQSDHLGADGVRPPGDGRPSFGSGLAAVRRLSSRLELNNRRGGGARVVAHRVLSHSVTSNKGLAS